MDKLTAEWESRGGAWGVALYRDSWGYTYRAKGAQGSFQAASDEEAIAYMERPVPWGGGDKRFVDIYQPDSNVTPMRRVQPAPTHADA